MTRLRLPPLPVGAGPMRPLGLLAGVASGILGLAVAKAVSPLLDTYTVLPSLAGVLLSAWYGGLWPGLVASLISLVGINFLFLSPTYAFSVVVLSDAIRFSFFLLISVATSYLSESRRRSAEALRGSEERMRLFIDAVRDYAILFLDAEGRIVRWTEGARRMTGHEPPEVVGRSIAVLYPPAAGDDESVAAHLSAAATVGEHSVEGQRVRKDGSTFWARMTFTALRRDRRLVGYSVVVRDLTERRRAEIALREANDEIAATTYAIAHDLRSPLRAIDAYAFLLLESYRAEVGEEGGALVGRIRGAAQRLGALIDGLLAVARVGRTEIAVEEVDLGALARRAFEEVRAVEPDRPAELVLSGDLTAVGDARLLGLVVENLVGNAWKFTAGRDPAVVAVARAEGAGAERVFLVRDNGVGFERHHAANLFRPFHRLHTPEEFPGHGIGLATVRRIVERHGGRVWAEGRPGEGATIFFTLPEPPSARGGDARIDKEGDGARHGSGDNRRGGDGSSPPGD